MKTTYYRLNIAVGFCDAQILHFSGFILLDLLDQRNIVSRLIELTKVYKRVIVRDRVDPPVLSVV